MESGFPHLTEIDGIDLSNYVRDPNSHNPVVYIHKRTLKRSNRFVDEDKKKSPKLRDTGQQFDFEDVFKDRYKVNVIKNDNHDPIMERTIQFAKNIIPITIPPKDKDDNAYYTIKSVKKTKTEHKSCKCNLNSVRDKQFNAVKIIKDKTKKTKTKKNISTTETISQSSQNTNNTVDDTNNQTLSELSELSEHSKLREDASRCKREFIPSESFEAIADQYLDAGKIKVNIMNEKEKNIFYENIRVPLVKAIKDSISQFCTSEIGKELNAVKAKIETYSSKLDVILDRLSKIEKKLNNDVPDQKIPLENVRIKKAAMLEELGEDIGVINANHSSDGDSQTSKRRREKPEIMSIHDVSDELGRGEKCSDSFKESPSYVGIKPATSNRIPARFCWTDAKIN